MKNSLKNYLGCTGIFCLFLAGCQSGASSSNTVPTFCQQNVANFSSINNAELLSTPFNSFWGHQ